MEEQAFLRLKKELHNAIQRNHIAGLKGEVLHPLIRQAVTNVFFRWVQNDGGKIDIELKKLKVNIDNHFVTTAEKLEYDIAHYIVKEHGYIYSCLHSILLYSKINLEHFDILVKDFFNLCRKKGMTKEMIDAAMNAFEKDASDFKEALDSIKSDINAIYNKETHTFAGNMTFLEFYNKTRDEGFWFRRQEKSGLKDLRKELKRLDDSDSKMRKVHNEKELEALLDQIRKEIHEMNKDLRIVAKLLFTSWSHLIDKTVDFIKLVSAAAEIHELPERDSVQMRELIKVVSEEVDQKYLSSLRMSENQLEAILEGVRNDIAVLRRYIPKR